MIIYVGQQCSLTLINGMPDSESDPERVRPLRPYHVAASVRRTPFRALIYPDKKKTDTIDS